MLRSLSRTLNSRLSPITLLSRASAEQSVSSSFAACVSGSRHLSADPVLEEEYRAADAACAHFRVDMLCSHPSGRYEYRLTKTMHVQGGSGRPPGSA